MRSGRESRLDLVAVTAAAYSALAFAFFTTLFPVDERLALLAVLGLLSLVSGVSLGGAVHGWEFENRVNMDAVYAGFMGVAFVAFAQLVAVFSGLSVYGLSYLDTGTRVVFLTAQAVAEEFLFAGFLLALLLRVSYSTVHAFVTVAVVFATFHWAVYSQSPVVLFAVFLSRLALNWVYARGGLTASITAHVAVNLMAALG